MADGDKDRAWIENTQKINEVLRGIDPSEKAKAASIFLVLLSQVNEMPKADFLELMSDTWDFVERDHPVEKVN